MFPVLLCPVIRFFPLFTKNNKRKCSKGRMEMPLWFKKQTKQTSRLLFLGVCMKASGRFTQWTILRTTAFTGLPMGGE